MVINKKEECQGVLSLLKKVDLETSVSKLMENGSYFRVNRKITLSYLLGKTKLNFKQTGLAKVFCIK